MHATHDTAQGLGVSQIEEQFRLILDARYALRIRKPPDNDHRCLQLRAGDLGR